MGNSWIPDLVDGIEMHFARLDSVMVAPSIAATAAIDSAFDQVGRDVAGHIGAMVRQGEITLGGFADFVDGMVQRIMDRMVQMAVVEPLTSAFAGGFAGMFTPAATAAHGLAFAGGEVQPFAKGGVVSRPTLFPFAKGIGLMGEAGPEAILPLTRLPGGDLGVRADIGRQSEGGVTVNIYDHRTQAAEPVEVKERVGADGHRIVEVMIRDQVNRMIVQGQTDRAMTQRYGMRPRGV